MPATVPTLVSLLTEGGLSTDVDGDPFSETMVLTNFK